MRYSEKFKNKAVRMYGSGLSTYKVAEKLGCGSSSVSRWVKQSEIPSRPRKHRKYSVNEDYFCKVDTAVKAYWIGFLLADGYLIAQANGKGKRVGITLKESDEQHLDKFRKALSANHPIKSEKKPKVRIRISSRKLYDDLFDLGLKPRKSLIAKPIEVPKHFRRDYFRGLVDGDGSIFYDEQQHRYGVDLAGTEEVVADFSTWLGYNGSYLYENGNETYHFRKTKRESVLNILHRLYHKAEVYLDRKYELYLEIKRNTTPSMLIFNEQNYYYGG